MSNFVYLLGPAGCGKSTLTSVLYDTMKGSGLEVLTVNLDPGVEWLPYTPEIDIRKYISLREVMREFRLGPNGALVVSVDLIVDHLPKLRETISAWNPDYVLVDTPGQMELFAFRDTGARIAERLAEESKAIVYLFDSVFCRDPLNYVMNMFIASAISTRFLLPQVPALSKADLLSEEEIEMITGWSEDPLLLEDALDSRLEGLDRILSQDMMDIINRLGLEFNPMPISSRTYDGFGWLYSELTRILTRGEKFTL